MKCSLRLLTVCGLVLVATPAWSTITYVDAVPNTNGSNGNTTVDGAFVTLFDSTLPGTGNATTDFNSTDNLWRYRSNGPLNGGAAWETHETEDTAPLVTTLSLAPGVYNLYGLFWGGAGASFIIDFRVGSTGAYSYFDTGSSSTLSAADGSDFSNDVAVRWPAGFGDLWIADLGEVAVSSTVDIYVNGPVTQLVADPRTVYDGVGYEFVRPIPEPSSMVITSIGLISLLGMSSKLLRK